MEDRRRLVWNKETSAATSQHLHMFVDSAQQKLGSIKYINKEIFFFVVAHPDVFVITVYNPFSQQHTLVTFIYYFALR
jgi:hypothetical protein